MGHEKKEKAKSRALRFPCTRSSVLLHLRSRVEHLDKLAADPMYALPYGEIIDWLAKQDIAPDKFFGITAPPGVRGCRQDFSRRAPGGFA